MCVLGLNLVEETGQPDLILSVLISFSKRKLECLIELPHTGIPPQITPFWNITSSHPTIEYLLELTHAGIPSHIISYWDT